MIENTLQEHKQGNRQLQKGLIITGFVIALSGILYPYLRKLSLGKLQGDVFYQSDNFSFAFPIVTCIIISVVVTLILNVFRN